MNHLLQLLSMLLLLHSQHVSMKQHTNFVIIGGTGDLARKYLWRSAMRLFSQNTNENNTFSFYAAARISQTEGKIALDKITKNVLCGPHDSLCEKLRPSFLKTLNYVQLKSDKQYADFCQNLSKFGDSLQDFQNKQIFYFSIPSSAYDSVAKSVYENCHQGKTSTSQVVLEKPFGMDRQTAANQANNIDTYFTDEETYRVDHYLAKSVTKQILSFRKANEYKLKRYMTNQYVDRVEIVMKETIGVKGRIDFYDQNGVIRDVIQNHLTELLALVAMEIPSNITNSIEIEENKIKLLQQIKAVKRDSLLVGQYSKYFNEAKEEKENISQSAFTPTFSAALLQIENIKWKGIPIVLLSGKHMDERSSYVRLLFRESEFCVSGCAGGNSTQTKYPRQIIFQIGHGSVPSPGVLVSKSLFIPRWPPGLQELTITSKDSLIHGQSPGDFYYAVPINDVQAYDTVLSDLYHNIKETFVTTARMLLLWDIWDDILRETKDVLPRLYLEGMAKNLNFNVDSNKLKYLDEDIQQLSEDGVNKIVAVPEKFRNNTLICKEKKELITSLAKYLLFVAEESIKHRSVFHLALSGGRTPIILFEEIVSFFPQFPWDQTHIWQVDERCLSFKKPESNFLSIYDNLLKFVSIPYFNIHPMPVNFAGKICNAENKGDKLYADLIMHLIPAQKFDFILLGLGGDGHVASLFPKKMCLKETKKLVAYTKSKKGGNLDRMSILLPVINNSREVTVLVTGKDKHDILHKISEIENVNNSFPITYVSPTDGKLSWYVDMESLIGN